MKYVIALLLVSSIHNSCAMNNTVKNRFHDELINRASDNAYCKFGDWGSENAEPVDAIIPASCGRSANIDSQTEQEKFQEAIRKMQNKRNTFLRQTTEDGSCLCLATIAITLCLAPYIHEYLK